MVDYNELAAVATDLIKEAGRLVTLQKLSATPADANKPWNGPAAPTVATQVANVGAAFVPPGGSGLGKSIVDEELIKRCEQIALVEPIQEGLEGMSRILDTDGQTWKIEWVQVLKPASKTVLYVMGVKR